MIARAGERARGLAGWRRSGWASALGLCACAALVGAPRAGDAQPSSSPGALGASLPKVAPARDGAHLHPSELPEPVGLELFSDGPAGETGDEGDELDDEVVTGAARREQSLGNVASAVTVIGADRIRRFGYRTVAEAIAGVAGVHLVDDRLSTRVGIRGLQPIGDFNTRILVVIDGTSMTESWSHLSGVGYDLPVSIDEIERIEVIRGPVSSIYGTNAFFGIINIITRGAVTKVRAWGRGTAAKIGGSGASAGFAAGTPSRQVRGAVSVMSRRGELTRYQGMEIDRQSDTGLSASLALSAVLGTSFAQLRAYSAHRVVPFAPYGGRLDDPYVQTNRQATLDVGHSRQWRQLEVSARAFASAYQFSDRASEDGTESRLFVTGKARTLGAEVRGRYQALARGRLTITAGVEATYNDTSHDARVTPMTEEPEDGEPAEEAPNGLTFTLGGLYAEVESAPTSWLGITAGVRADRNSEFSSGGRVSPRLAVFLSPGTQYGAKLLYAEGFRNPSTYEAYYDDDDIKANPELSPESIRSYELVAWARPNPSISLRASGYRWEALDVMKQIVSEDTDGRVQYQNQARYRSVGVELEGRIRDPKGFFAFAAANLADVRDEDGEKLAGAPTVTVSVGASTAPLWAGLSLSSELMYIGERATASPEQMARAHLSWNAAVVLPAWRGFDLTVGGRNLLGRREQVPAAEDYLVGIDPVGIVPGEGRELYVRIGRSLQ